jgi:hypothetical protein
MPRTLRFGVCPLLTLALLKATAQHRGAADPTALFVKLRAKRPVDGRRRHKGRAGACGLHRPSGAWETRPESPGADGGGKGPPLSRSHGPGYFLRRWELLSTAWARALYWTSPAEHHPSETGARLGAGRVARGRASQTIGPSSSRWSKCPCTILKPSASTSAVRSPEGESARGVRSSARRRDTRPGEGQARRS